MRYTTLMNKIRRAKTPDQKTAIWLGADLLRAEYLSLVRLMVLSLPKGYYKLHSREYGTNIVDTVWEMYGWMPSMMIDENILLGLQATNEDRVYASFTHGLDAIQIK